MGRNPLRGREARETRISDGIGVALRQETGVVLRIFERMQLSASGVEALRKRIQGMGNLLAHGAIQQTKRIRVLCVNVVGVRESGAGLFIGHTALQPPNDNDRCGLVCRERRDGEWKFCGRASKYGAVAS